MACILPLIFECVTHGADIPAFGGKLDVSWNPESQVTQWGGLAYFVSYLKTSGLFDRLVEDAPFHYTSPNAPDVRDIAGTTVLAIVCGFTRYVHINRLRDDLVISGRKRLLHLTSTHLKAREIQSSPIRIGEFMKRISASAEQLDFNRAWELTILAAFRKWLGGNRAKGLLPEPLAMIG